MDWNLRTCARKGHVTFAPEETKFRERLTADTPLGNAWRCLRCGTYVLGDPQGTGPADKAPVLLRGTLAIERWLRGAVMILLAIGVLRLRSTRVSLQQLFSKDLSSLKPFFEQIHFNVSDSSTIHTIQKVLDAKPTTLNLIAAGLFVYGGMQWLEGIGLWSLKRWGEYVAVVGTSIFVPLEVYELTEKISWLKLVVLLINLAAVVYLLVAKRLFGIRGGGRAYEASLHEASLLEVETSAQAVS